ncbi:hypothetical protein EMCRGX_G026397 [Ephydatia muelleri]
MPHCIAKGCMNRDNKCPKGVSFHRLPPNKPISASSGAELFIDNQLFEILNNGGIRLCTEKISLFWYLQFWCVKYRTCYPMFAVNQIEQKVLKSFNEDSQLRTDEK